MANKIFKSTIFVAAIVLLCSVGIIIGVLYDYFDGVQETQLMDELRLAAVGTNQEGTRYLEKLSCESFRLTWIGPDGQVLFDSKKSTSGMENHADRQEIQQAFAEGSGSSVRYSNTLLEKTRYEAIRLEDGSVLRISGRQASSAGLSWGLMKPIMLIVIIAVALSGVLARRIANRIVKPLNELNLEQPLSNRVYEEISPLLKRINQLHLQVSAQMQVLQRRMDEFTQITANMKEGLVLLDREDRVVNMNPAARLLLGAEEDCTGRDFLTIDSSREMRSAVDGVFLNGSSRIWAWRNGREYQFDLSRIESDGSAVGAVVLAFDVTEQQNAERTRREFSANVSHELKTPLQSIIGSAELLEHGLVKPEDQARFLGNIQKEATRLVSLIEDIIRLSQLDEGETPPAEPVNLTELAREAVSVLTPAAQEKQVQIAVTGPDITVQGVRRLFYEVVYNLCDNAIKYNVTGGSVAVSLSESGKQKILQVEDTGIGIPQEHQDRVFERFYRVDKSHSRQSGGTGLGLSIVKHAVIQLGGKLELSSSPGKGTVIKAVFEDSL